MNLTGRELVEKGIITNVMMPENIQQHGVDLNLIRVERIIGSIEPGIVFANASRKTKLATRQLISLTQYTNLEVWAWHLTPGAYDITFSQGCRVPSDQRLFIRQRSSLLRNGTILHSSVFDAGFFTDNIGTVMIVKEPILIESGARVAQIYASLSNEVNQDDLYNGQWQNDKQRASETK